MNKADMFFEVEHETIIALVDLIGKENTRKLVETFGGSYIYIPSAETLERKYRDINIYDNFLSGMSYTELRRKYQLSEPSIRRKAVRNERK